MAHPLVEIAVEARAKANQEKLGQALARFAAEEPCLGVAIDRESDQIVIKGTGEAALEMVVDRARRELMIEVNVGAPQVAYRETITRPVVIDHTYPSGERAPHARVTLRFEPARPGEGYAFKSEIVGDAVPGECLAGVARGLGVARETGMIAGYPVIDFTATLIDGVCHDVDASALAFEMAARRAFREAIPKAAPRLLEPVMKVEVVTPGEYMTAVAGDLRSRRGKVTDVSRRNDALVIAATMPLASMLGYAPALERLSQGRATFDMRFSHYVSVPVPPTDDTPPFGPALGMRA